MEALEEEDKKDLEKEAKAKKTKLSEKGMKDAPAVFRRTEIPKFRDGRPNPDARVLGGVLVTGEIVRDVTVNLIALRGLRGKDAEETKCIQRYLLALSLLAATAELDLFLREGCHLRYADNDVWHVVPRRGKPKPVDLGSPEAKTLIQSYASTAAAHFHPKGPAKQEYNFDLKEAKKLLAKKDASDEE